MTTQEFSNMFDTLLNSYNTEAMFGEAASKADIVLDEYEKSVLLTQAQDFIVKSYFDRTLNYQGQGFDDSSRRQVDFSSLIKVSTMVPATGSANGFDDRSVFVTMPDKALFILNEKVIIDGKNYVVVPINYKEYDRQMSKAFTQPLKKQCWRLVYNDVATTKFEIIPFQGKKPSSYLVRYIERPKPIVLANLTADGLEIDGVSTVSECTLNPILHMDILNKAVEMAITARGSYADAIRRKGEEIKSKS